ncbi:hypothetical protein [Microcella alkaliphila]|nr:hypothetical protein [Microcella alkaliphila]
MAQPRAGGERHSAPHRPQQQVPAIANKGRLGVVTMRAWLPRAS